RLNNGGTCELTGPYPSELLYNFFENGSELIPANRIVFGWEDRSDHCYMKAGKSHYVGTQRLATISVESFVQNAYQRQSLTSFTYYESFDTQRSLLSGVGIVAPNTSQLPRLTFRYASPGFAAFSEVRRSLPG